MLVTLLSPGVFDQNSPHGLGSGSEKMAAVLEVLIAEQQLNVAVTNQLHEARLAFYTAVYNRDLKNIRSAQLQRLKSNASAQSERYQSGLVPRTVSVNAEVQADELMPQIEGSDRAYSGAELNKMFK